MGTRTTTAYSTQPRASSVLNAGIKTSYIYGFFQFCFLKCVRVLESWPERYHGKSQVCDLSYPQLPLGCPLQREETKSKCRVLPHTLHSEASEN